MSELTIAQDLLEKIKIGAPVYQERVFLMVSREAYLFANVNADPSVVLVYVSTTPGARAKNGARTVYTHLFEVHVFQSIWAEDAVVLDSEKGLFVLRGDLVDLLDSSRTGFSQRILDIWVGAQKGTQDYPTVDASGLYKSSISFELFVKEET